MSGCLILAVMSAVAQGPADFDAFFEEFAKKRDGMRVLQARFVQETVVPEETLKNEGAIVYVKPKRLVFRYDAPEPTYIIDGQEVYEYAPDLEQLQIYDLEDNPQTEAFFLGFDDDTNRLRKAYDIEVLDPQGEPEAAKAVVLRPKPAENGETYFEKVTLFLRGSDYVPYRIEIVNDAESRVTIRVKDIVINGPLAPGQAQVKLPKGTAIIRDERLVETVAQESKLLPDAPVPLPEPRKDPAP